MKLSFDGPSLTCLALALLVSLVTIPPAFAQKVPSEQEVRTATERAVFQSKLQQVLKDKAGYAKSIVVRWEAEARALGRWDPNYGTDLFGALMKVGTRNLLAAGEATSYEAMMAVLATGQRARLTAPRGAQSITPQTLGDLGNDLVYTPVTPCRIVDTRNISSPILAGTTRGFDVDGTTFVSQGGVSGSCGIPFGVASAVAMTLTSFGPLGPGFFAAFAVGSGVPNASSLNYSAGETIANSTIVPVTPGGGNDFNVFAGTSTAHLIVDVIGYFAAPVATALECTTVSTDPPETVANGDIYSISSTPCPAGFAVTGGGQSTSTFFPLISDSRQSGDEWICQGTNNSGSDVDISCEVTCCRVPGR